MDEDDLVFYAWGATCNGYWAMVGRTIYVGQKPPANLQDAFAVTRAALDAAVLKLRPGNTAGEAGQAADDVIAASDFDTMCPVTVGGGMGLAMGELPSLHPSDSTTLQPGMVFRVGTEMYLRGRGTITCKSLVAVEADGPRYLIHPPDGIICV
jgi:Xaa-Pro aminopeptidase